MKKCSRKPTCWGRRDLKSDICQKHGIYNYFNYFNKCPKCLEENNKCPHFGKEMEEVDVNINCNI